MSSPYLVLGLKTRWVLIGKEVRIWEPVEVDPQALRELLATMGVDPKIWPNMGRLRI
jgi:hypothetical protein